MGDAPKSTKDVRVRHVSLHSRGKTENGTIYLTRHHLIFSYLPDATASAPRTSNLASRVVSGSHVTSNTRAGASLDGASYRDSTDSTVTQSTPKARPKEIWVPYPMINHCVLRPSTSQGSRTHDYDTRSDSVDRGLEETAFPPVYGTSPYTRPSTDSARLAPYSSPQKPSSPGIVAHAATSSDAVRVPALRIRRRDFQMMAFHFHHSTSEKSSDEAAREIFYCLRSRCCVDNVQDMHALHFTPPPEELAAGSVLYDGRREFARMGIGGKAAEGRGSAWRLSDINRDYSYSSTYPSVLCVPRSVSDNLLKYGGVFRSKARIPALTYLHSNGGSITRSSQPLVGIQSKRNPQDERLVSAIFSSHTPSQRSPSDSPDQRPLDSQSKSPAPDTNDADTLDDVPGLSLNPNGTTLAGKDANAEEKPQKKIYGSTRRNMIIDARPKVNALANRATGGGIEDVSNYLGASGTTIERIFLNIANIHAMRKSVEKVIESFANSDYLDMKPNQELLRNSGWLPHIANLLDGAEMVARVVGLGGSHVLVHCSDGWDRTSQVAALAEVMLDPFYRSLLGFITLIQKDFLAFGHKFNHRHGIQGSEKWFEIENERVMPSRANDATSNESTGLNKAFYGAKNWFEKGRSNMFRQQNDSRAPLEGAGSRPPSPPPNPILHSIPTTRTKEDREHKTDPKEIAPIFHQFLDAVFQLQYHYPDAFEFNERFLRRLFYQVHSGQYGEFLFNNEKDRGDYESKFPSAWAHFMSRKEEFINPEYVKNVGDPLLFPKRHNISRDVDVRWWSTLFGRKDEDMNTPHALTTPDLYSTNDTAKTNAKLSVVSLVDPGSHSPEKDEAHSVDHNALKAVESMSSLEVASGGFTSAPNSSQTESAKQPQFDPAMAEASSSLKDVSLEQREPMVVALGEPAGAGSATEQLIQASTVQSKGHISSDEGDPLGVSGARKVQEVPSSRLELAAFAQQSAYSDR